MHEELTKKINLKELGKITPYGIYDINRKEGFVNLGISKVPPEGRTLRPPGQRGVFYRLLSNPYSLP